MTAVLQRDDDCVRILTLNRAHELNALTVEAMSELGGRLEAAAATRPCGVALAADFGIASERARLGEVGIR